MDEADSTNEGSELTFKLSIELMYYVIIGIESLIILSLISAIIRRYFVLRSEIRDHAATLRKKRIDDEAQRLEDMIKKTKEVEKLQRRAEMD